MFQRLLNKRKSSSKRPGSVPASAAAAELAITTAPTPPDKASATKSTRRKSSSSSTRRRKSSSSNALNSSKALLGEDESYDFFLSHHQALGGDQAQILYLVLQDQSYRVWYDMQATDLTKDGMAKGIENSSAYVLLLTDGVMEREFVQFEARTALALQKHIILLYETDAAHGGVIDSKTGKIDIGKLKAQTPKDLRGPLFDNIELIPFERRNYRQKAMIDEMAKRANVVPSVNRDSVVKFDTGFDALVMPRQKAEEFARGFRTWILKLVKDWFTQGEPWSQVFVLMGGAGVGKSVVCGKLCELGGLLGDSKSDVSADEIKFRKSWPVKVAATHFFKHDNQITSDASRCVLSLANQLADNVPGFELPQGLDVGSLNLVTLFSSVISEPANATPNPGYRMVLILDALDECDPRQREALLDIIQRQKLPSWLGIIVSTRPETYIPFKLKRFNPFELDTESESNRNDIRHFLEFKLKPLMKPKDLPAAVDVLLERSGGLFLYARFIDDLMPRGAKSGGPSSTTNKGRGPQNLTLEDIKDSFPDGLSGVFGEYFGRFQKSLDEGKGKSSEELYQQRLAPIVAARAPLPERVWRGACGYAPAKKGRRDPFLKALGQAKQLLYVANKEVRLVHKSMSDWLTNEEGSGDLFVEQIPGHEVLAKWCLENLNDPFSVRHLAYHCCFAGLQQELRELCMSFEWLQQSASGLLARDMDTFYAEDGEEMDTELRVVVNAIRLSERALKFDRKELASQLIGRIRDVKHPIVVQALAFHHPDGFLLPVMASLTPADTALRNVLVGHTERVTKMSFSPDGKLLVSGSHDNSVGVWSAESGELLRTIVAHTDWVNCVDFHSEHGLVATASDDGTARVFRVATGEELHVLRPLDTLLTSDYTKGRSVCFSKAHGVSILAVGWINGFIDFYKVDDDFSPIGTWNLWRAKEDEEDEGKTSQQTKDAEPGCGSAEKDLTVPRKGASLLSLDWSPAMNMLSSGWKDGVARCVRIDPDAFTGKVSYIDRKGKVVHTNRKELVVKSKTDVKIFQKGKFPVRVKFHDNGKWLLSVNVKICVWDISTGKLVRELKGHKRTCVGLAVTPNGKYVVSVGEDITYRVHDIESGALLHTEQGAHLKQLTSLALSPNGKILATGGDDNVIKLWEGWMDELSGEGKYVAAAMNGQNTTLKLSNHGKLAASVNSKFGVRVWDTRSGICLATLDGKFLDCDFSPDSSILVTAGRDLMIRAYDMKTFKKIKGVELDMVEERELNTTRADRVLFVNDDVVSITTTAGVVLGPDNEVISITTTGVVLGLNVRTGKRIVITEDTMKAAVKKERIRLNKTRMQHLSFPGYEVGFTTDTTYKVYSRVHLKERVAVVSEGPSLHILRFVGDGKSLAVHPIVKADLEAIANKKEDRRAKAIRRKKEQEERYLKSQALGKKMNTDREERKRLAREVRANA